ncbi:MAG: AmmeMemoRadiSam system radical SAM enzyme [Candidatus Micrarchaeaceae archaeon]
MEKEALLYEALPGGKVKCTACNRYCILPEGSKGFCMVRKNVAGKLYLLNYGMLEAIQLDPIEKKPFNHFHPGSKVFGIGTSSCNFGCLFCQNNYLSKTYRTDEYFSPEEIVGLAEKYNADGIAYTYNEPTIFIEYALDVAKLAKSRGLFNVFVTNGYMSKEAISLMQGLIDAAVVDFKGNGDEKFANKYEAVPSSKPIKEALLLMKKFGMHIEITDLVVPKVGDSLEACNDLTKWIAENLGVDTPVQFTRFYPSYMMQDLPPTPLATLKAHYDIAVKNGLNYVYIGNVPGSKYENTYCPKCKALVIGRNGFSVIKLAIDENGRCMHCGTKIFINGKAKLSDSSITSFY